MCFESYGMPVSPKIKEELGIGYGSGKAGVFFYFKKMVFCVADWAVWHGSSLHPVWLRRNISFFWCSGIKAPFFGYAVNHRERGIDRERF
jgi:hypothetical protein